MLEKIKLFLLVLLVLLLSFSLDLSADATLSQKISKLHQLPKSERFKLMNEIKRDMSRLNATQRSQALDTLRAHMEGKHQGKGQGMGKGLGKRGLQHQQNNPNCQNPQRKHDGKGPHNGEKNGSGKKYTGLHNK